MSAYCQCNCTHIEAIKYLLESKEFDNSMPEFSAIPYSKPFYIMDHFPDSEGVLLSDTTFEFRSKSMPVLNITKDTNNLFRSDSISTFIGVEWNEKECRMKAFFYTPKRHEWTLLKPHEEGIIKIIECSITVKKKPNIKIDKKWPGRMHAVFN